MTNREKFKDVFGFELDFDNLGICNMSICDTCVYKGNPDMCEEEHRFWDCEYGEGDEDDE